MTKPRKVYTMEGLVHPEAASVNRGPTLSTMAQAPHENDESLSVAQLLTIDVYRLQQGDEEEAAKLFKASKEDGAFYLDFSDQRRMKMMEMVGQIFALSKDLFDLSLEEKMEYDVDLRGALKLNGYKPVGRNFGGINGKSDGFESYQIPGKPYLSTLTNEPPVLTHAFSHVSSFSTGINTVLSLLLSSLSTSLNLSHENSLSTLHRANVASPDIIRLLHYIPQPATETGHPQTPHTDLGSLTILFSGSAGLQVLKPQSEKWAFVLPKPNCAVVNIGDGLSILTGGLLHSCLHRVGPLPGRAMEERYSFAYLQRAEDDVMLAPLPGMKDHSTDMKGVATSRQWLENKFGMLRAKTRKEGMEGQKILTGRANMLPT